MKAWSVVQGVGGKFRAARQSAETPTGFVTDAGGETEAESKARAERLAAIYNKEREEKIERARAERAARKEAILSGRIKPGRRS